MQNIHYKKWTNICDLIFHRLKMIEIMCNFFRSVIVLSPGDLLQCVYLCLNKLAPAYQGVELGVGETVLMKAIAQATGEVSLYPIRLSLQPIRLLSTVYLSVVFNIFILIVLKKEWRHPIASSLQPSHLMLERRYNSPWPLQDTKIATLLE